ncbi:MAG: peptidyl-prolyl cis-trans isomerase [Betaproteobacteria bacterium]|nr:peptidyl-prolyl cis-trans isomerase [Betaproteobacteria bacterium]
MLKPLLPLFLLLLSQAALAASPQVEMKTTLGIVTLELYPDKAPKTVENFLQYVKDGHYNGTIFHRVIKGFMIQGGGFEKPMLQKRTRAPIENEAGNGLRNDSGTLAMARTSNPHSASAQFFINVANNEFLNFRGPTPQGYGYAVFGKVVKGMEVVEKISLVPTGNMGPFSDVPLEAVAIQEMKLLAPEPAAKPAR